MPLASTATVKLLHASEVEELGFEMVLGNTFHLFIQPGHELVRELGGLHEFMTWRRPIITDSGRLSGVLDGTRVGRRGDKRRRDKRQTMVISIEEEGVRFRSYADGTERFMGPETSMEVQAALGSDIALAFDERTPFHVERDYTARSMERTHRWLDRCVAWCGRVHAPKGQLLYGIVQGGVYEDLRASRAPTWPARAWTASPSAARSARRRRRCTRSSVGRSPASPTSGRGTCSALATWTTSCMPWAGIDLRLRNAHAAGRHGTALVHDPGKRWRLDLTKSGHRRSREPIDADCPCQPAASTRAATCTT